MLRHLFRPPVYKRGTYSFSERSVRRSYALRAPSKYDQETLQEARQWLAGFDAIPERLYAVTYSRSSGPGGQNVNKTNSKATLRIDLKSLYREVPLPLHEAIRQSPYCTSKSECIVITSDDSRKQTDNTKSCKIKLNNLIIEAGRKSVPRETSDVMRFRIKNREKAADHARLQSKSMHSDKKSARKSGGGRSSSDL